MKKFTDFLEALDFLENHKIFGCDPLKFLQCWEYEIQEIPLKVETIDSPLGAEWNEGVILHCGKLPEPSELEPAERVFAGQGLVVIRRDPDLTCRAPSWREAIIELANLVYKKYGE